MGRAIRNEAPGYHHVVTRGNNKRDIYLDDLDRMLFALRVSRVAQRNDWKVLTYVLMRNHYHLLLQVGDEGLSAGMQSLNQGYAITYNTRHGRINHLFGKRYWSRYLTTEASVQATARYIVQNPVRAGGRLGLEHYAWSSYAATIGVSFSHIPLARDELLAFFGDQPKTATEEFMAFCREQPRSDEI
jgi:REP element-mobilizing transposase RayT